MSSVAVFWDRDNTLIRDPGFISDPGQVELLPGAAEALIRLTAGGFENIIVTNQSGIARGKFDEATLERIHDRMVGLFAEQGARIDAIYFCPFLAGEEATVEKYRQDSELRKPKPGMILQASLERKIDLAGSWMIGDRLHDAQAGRAAGCRTIIIRRQDATEPIRKGGDVDFVVDSVEEAAETVLKYTRRVGGGAASGSPRATAVSAVPEHRSQTEGPAQGSGDVATTLQEILSFMRAVDRRSRADEFALGKMLGAIVQIVALGVVTWAIFGFIRGEPVNARLLLAIVFQLMALTCFSLSPRK